MRLLPALALCFALGLSAPALAQVHVGVRAGLNVADWVYTFQDETADVDVDPRLGFVGGATIGYRITPRVGARAEVLYTQKGFADEISVADDADAETGTLRYRQDYIEVPILADVALPAGDGLELGLHVGPALGFRLGDIEVSCSGALEGAAGCDGSGADNDAFRPLDVGGAVGISVGAGPFGVDLRYTRSLRRLGEAEPGPAQGSIFNSVFSVAGTYRLR